MAITLADIELHDRHIRACRNQEKQIEKSITKEKKKHKMFPINPERLDRILKKIGRKKL